MTATSRPIRAGGLQCPGAKCTLLALLFGATALASRSRAQTAPTTQPTLESQLESADAKASQIEDLTADFEQRKFSALLRDPLVTRGQVLAKRTVMLWRGQTPEPTRMRVSLERMQIYYVNQKLIEDYPIIGKLGSLAASPLPRLATLRERFTLSADHGADLKPIGEIAAPLAVRLTPIEDEVKQYVDHVRVLLDTSRGLVMVFELTDPDGERTVIRFSNVHTNTNLSDAELALDAPKDVKIVKPLEPGK